MTNAELAKTFFPGVRKELRVKSILPLTSREGEKRIKLDLLMPLDDGKQVGMPSWVGEAFDHMGKEDAVERFTKFDVELEAMSLYCHTTEDIAVAAQTLFNVMLTSFSMIRGNQDEEDEELSGIALKFVAKVPANLKLWNWLYPYHLNSIFIRFETTQAELGDAPKQEEKQLSLAESKENIKAFAGAAPVDEFEEDRRRATSKEADAEFPPALAASGKGDSTARKPRGFDRKTN